MLSLKKPKSDETHSSDGPSFGERFRAWWDGYEVDAKPKATKATKVNRGALMADIRAEKGQAAARDDLAPVDRSTKWPQLRRDLAQMVWGEGFVGPGNSEFAIEMVQAFGLDSSSSMLEIGAGLGGGTRAIAKQLGAYVEGFDLEPELAAEATVQAGVHSLDLKAAVNPLDPETLELKTQYYVGAVVRETLYRIADKKAFLAKVVESLKAGGHLVILDLFFADDAATSEMDRWRDGERSEAYGWQIDEARETLEKLHVDVRACSDETDSYRAHNIETWKKFVRQVRQEPVPNELVLTMADEAEFWARRMTAMETGDLKVYRLTCLRSNPVK